MRQVRLLEFIRDHRAEIISAWERAVRSLPVARDLDDVVLLDHIPALLERIAQMAEQLEHGHTPELPLALAGLHASDRLDEGFDLTQVVIEYSLLRDCVTQSWQEAGAGCETLAELRVFNQAIDRAVAASVDRFTRARDRTLQGLDRIANAALESRDLDELLRRLLQVLLDTTAAVDTAAIWLRDGNVLQLRASVGLEDVLMFARPIEVGVGFLGRIAVDTKARSIRPGADDGLIDPELRERGVRAIHGVPLIEHDDVFGVAQMGSLTANVFSMQDKRLLGTMAARAASAIRQHMLHEQTDRQAKELRERSEEQRFLAEATQVLTSSLNYAETLDKLAQLAVPTLADWCMVDIVYDGDASRVAIAHRDPAKLEIVRAWSEYPIGWDTDRGPARVMRTGRPELIARIEDERIAETIRNPEHAAAIRALGLGSYLAVPLVARGRTLGVITMLTDAPRELSVKELDLARELGHRAGLAIDNGRLYKEEQDAVRLREQVLSIVSHDLRTPLATIELAAALALQVDGNEERVRKQLETVLRSSTRMNHIISDLLDMTRIRGGRLVLDKKPCDAALLVGEAIDVHGPIASKKGVQLIREGHVEGVAISCDRERISQVFANLLGNAIKFCEPGATITLRAERRGKGVRFEIADTGPGIPEQDLPHVFEPYYSAQRHAKHGIGLGLYICKGIVEAHGGEMTVASTPGHGATFAFWLPVGDL